MIKYCITKIILEMISNISVIYSNWVSYSIWQFWKEPLPISGFTEALPQIKWNKFLFKILETLNHCNGLENARLENLRLSGLLNWNSGIQSIPSEPDSKSKLFVFVSLSWFFFSSQKFFWLESHFKLLEAFTATAAAVKRIGTFCFTGA